VAVTATEGPLRTGDPGKHHASRSSCPNFESDSALLDYPPGWPPTPEYSRPEPAHPALLSAPLPDERLVLDQWRK
jgi:hypothetical protein